MGKTKSKAQKKNATEDDEQEMKEKKTESQEMEDLIRKQLKDFVKLLKKEGIIFTHDDTPMLVATLNAALENKQLIDAVTKQMLDIDWDTGPIDLS